MESLLTVLHTLSDVVAPSGHEIEMRRVLRPLLAEHVDELRVDALGNLIALKRGTGAVPLRVMVAAHMDEVGLMVMDHTAEGHLRVKTFGSIDERLLPGLQVLVGPEQLPGVMGVQAVHRTKADSFERVTPLDSLVVDIGAASKDEAARLAPVGTIIGFATRFHEVGALVAGKALDDRAGCTTLVSLLQGERFPFDLYGVFTVQEEVGLRGAQVAAYALEPDVALALEGTIADDLPKDEDSSPTTTLGQGPAITVMDRAVIADPRLVQLLVQTAQAEGIPYQFKQPGIGSTDAGTIHRARGGVPSVTVAVPCRYIHSPVSLLDPRDLEWTVRLLQAALRRLTPELLQVV